MDRPADKAAAIDLIGFAHDQGITLFDTAQADGPFAKEELVGEAVLRVRDQVVIAAKFGFDIESCDRRAAAAPTAGRSISSLKPRGR